MNETPRGERLHIALFGLRNAGKSSLINALTGQERAIVSSVPGTTADPVYQAMEILPIGPVVLIDTAGIDDEGTLGRERVKKAEGVLEKTDLALIVLDGQKGLTPYERDWLERLEKRKIPSILVLNKADLSSNSLEMPSVRVSALTGEGIEALKKEIIRVSPKDRLEAPIIGDLLRPGDTVVLVTPIDTSAPKGRLILPQVQTIREVLDADCMAFVTKERELRRTLESLKTPPRMVVTDSQAFLKVAADTPPEIPLTSFSILFARYKGDLLSLAQGAKAIMGLHSGDKVLIAESCTHHKQADDIGTVKIPRWLRQYVGGPLQIDHAHGGDFPENLGEYQLVIHCGGCMTNRQAMLSRIFHAQEAGVPITNYGVAIAFLQGIFPRALEPFPEIHALFS